MTDVIQERIQLLEQRLASDPQSPLFARLASMYLKAGRASDALRLCDDGLALYPFYSTAHLVKGKALVELGMMAEAKHEYEVVYELLPTNETLARLVSSVEVGSSLDLGTAQTQEIVPEPEVFAAAPPVEEAVVEEPQPTVTEEIPQPEPQSTEESSAPVKVISAPEPVPEHAENIALVEAELVEEDSFGVQASPTVEAEQILPSGYETPAFGADETPQLDTTEAGFTVTPEEPQASSAPVEEPQASAHDYSFGVAETAPPVEPIAKGLPVVPEIVEPSPSNVTEDAFGVPIEAHQAEPVVEPMPFAEPAVAEPPPVVEPTAIPESIEPFAPVVVAATVPEPPAAQTVAAEAPPANTDQTPDWFEAFAQFQQTTTETAEAPPTAPVEEENPFAMFGAEQTPAAAEGESYEDYAARVRLELFGMEDTVTLDEYLGSSSQTEQPPATDQIGELAEKLRSSPRITPPVINFSEKAPRQSTEGGATSGSGFVTPTLAEIYVNQGWFDDAIKAYRALVVNKPGEKEKFEQRIAEIEEMKKKQWF